MKKIVQIQRPPPNHSIPTGTHAAATVGTQQSLFGPTEIKTSIKSQEIIYF